MGSPEGLLSSEVYLSQSKEMVLVQFWQRGKANRPNELADTVSRQCLQSLFSRGRSVAILYAEVHKRWRQTKTLTDSFPPPPSNSDLSCLTWRIYLPPAFGKKQKISFLWANFIIRHDKMDTKMRKINFNTYVYSKTANRLFWRPQHHVDDIYDMRRSCCRRWKTSGRRRLDSSSWLL